MQRILFNPKYFFQLLIRKALAFLLDIEVEGTQSSIVFDQGISISLLDRRSLFQIRKQLLGIVTTLKIRCLRIELDENAAETEHVYSRAIVFLTDANLRRSIASCSHIGRAF